MPENLNRVPDSTGSYQHVNNTSAAHANSAHNSIAHSNAAHQMNYIISILLIVLNTIFGLQIITAFITLLNNFFRERPSISLIEVGIYALVTFLLVFLTGFLFLIRKDKLLLLLAVVICAARILLQVNPWPPLSLAVSAIGTVFWLASVAYFISITQEKMVGYSDVFYPSLFLWFTVATGLNGVFRTWDLIWQDNAVSYLLVFGMAFCYLWSASKLYSGFKNHQDHKKGYRREAEGFQDGNRAVLYTLITFMPFILLQLYRFQNIAALSAVTGTSTELSTALITLSNIAVFSIVYFIEARLPERAKRSWIGVLISAAFLLIFLSSMLPAIGNGSSSLYIDKIILGNLSSWWLFFIMLKKASNNTPGENNLIGEQAELFIKEPGHKIRMEQKKHIPWKNISAVAISGILFFIFAFIYYGSYDMSILPQSWIVVFTAAVLFGLCALFASLSDLIALKKGNDKRLFLKEAGTKKIRLVPLYLLMAIIIFPLVLLIPAKNDPEIFSRKDYVRIMDYNIHQGFNIHGYLDLESIARVIEGSGADIVALQEVSRGWVINSSADCYERLAHRLGMEYKLFIPASDDIWGNAILSRYP